MKHTLVQTHGELLADVNTRVIHYRGQDDEPIRADLLAEQGQLVQLDHALRCRQPQTRLVFLPESHV